MTNVEGDRRGASSRRIRSPVAPSSSQMPPELASMGGLTVTRSPRMTVAEVAARVPSIISVTRSPRMTAAEVAARLPSNISVFRLGDNNPEESALLEPKQEVEVITID